MWKQLAHSLTEQKMATLLTAQGLAITLAEKLSIATFSSTVQLLSSFICMLGAFLLARKSYYDTKKTRIEIEHLLDKRRETERKNDA